MYRMLIISVLILQVAGCKSEAQVVAGIIDANRSSAEAKLATFEKIGQDAKDRSVSSGDYGTFENKDLKLDFTDAEGSNATWALVDDLVDLSKQAEPQIRFQSEDFDLILTIADFLKKRGRSMSGDLRLNKNYVTGAFEQLERVKYLLVVRVDDYWPATQDFEDTFSPGRVSGDALLYQVDGEKFLGAVTFEAKSSDTNVLGENEGDEKLQEDLASNMFHAIREQLKKSLPAAKVQEDLLATLETGPHIELTDGQEGLLGSVRFAGKIAADGRCR